MAVVQIPPPRPNEFGRGLERAASSFAQGITRRREREERDRIARAATISNFVSSTLPQAQNEDQVRRLVNIYEEANQLGKGFFGEESIALIASGNKIEQERKKLETATKTAQMNLAEIRTRDLSSQITAREGKTAFDRSQKQFSSSIAAAAEARAKAVSDQQIVESKQRVKASEAKLKAGPAKEKPSVTVRENAATRELLFKEDLMALGFSAMSIEGFENRYTPSGGFDPTNISAEEATKVNMLIDKYGLVINKLVEERVPNFWVPESFEKRKFTQKGGMRLPIKRVDNPVDILKEATDLLPRR